MSEASNATPVVPAGPLVVRSQEQLAKAIEPVSGMDMMTLATVMVQSGFFPDLRSVAQGAVKILAGREMGFPPVASLRHIYVHKGHIGLQAILVATKIRESGRYDYKVLRDDDEGAEIEIQRKVDGQWRVEGAASFTIDDAKLAGLVREDSGYKSYPSDMLFARAMMRAHRRYCPDVLGQAVYSPDEIAEIAARDPEPAAGNGADVGADLMPRRKGEAPAQAPVEVPAESAPRADAGSPTSATDDEWDIYYGAMLGTAPGEIQSAGAATATSPPAPGPEPVDEELAREMWLDKVDRLVAERKIKAPVVAAQWERHVACDRAQAPWAKLQALHEHLDALTAAKPAAPAPAAKPGRVSFQIGRKTYETAGITRELLLDTFKLGDEVDKKAKSALSKAILAKEFKVEHRTDLTLEAAQKYLIRLREVLEP